MLKGKERGKGKWKGCSTLAGRKVVREGDNLL
jgi:hypothetical protein